MKCSAIFCLCRSQSDNSLAFRGVPSRTPNIEINGWQDAIKAWDFLKSAKYLDVHSDTYNPSNKNIRMKNYSFLDKLVFYSDKSEFINKYCEFTGFPYLNKISQKIVNTFSSCLNNISRYLNGGSYKGTYDIIDWGCDPTCSVSLKKALPGSDLDKGYIILSGSDTNYENENIVNNFKGKLWSDLDQRIVSLNHRDTFPDVYTVQQIKDKLAFLDKKSAPITDNTTKMGVMAAGGAVVLDVLLGPFGVPLGIALGAALAGGDKNNKYRNIKESTEIDPYKAGIFNIDLAKTLSSSLEREDAKNFAFFIESVDANLRKNSGKSSNSIFEIIKNSNFVQNSNVTQISAWQKKIDGGYLKSKLRNRENLSFDFAHMSVDERYDLIKDVIKYSSDDQSNRFPQYFKNDDDIKDRYTPLLEALK